MADTTGAGEGGYQYLWDNDLKAFFQGVPDNLLYKVNGQPVVYLWSDNSFAFTNQGNGNSARMLQYVRDQAKATFNENPYFVVDKSWLQNDASVSTIANGQDGWFGVPSPAYTNLALNGIRSNLCDRVRVWPKSFVAAYAARRVSRMLWIEAVGRIRTSSRPARSNRARNSCSVRS
jgi:hypothetical protein